MLVSKIEHSCQISFQEINSSLQFDLRLRDLKVIIQDQLNKSEKNQSKKYTATRGKTLKKKQGTKKMTAAAFQVAKSTLSSLSTE